MTKALYRKYRSKKLSEIVGQDHVTDILSRSLKKGIVSHAYLLTGPRGVGKTSIARILAHEINGLPYDDESTHLDIIEIDAASNNGVEDVRDLRDKVQIAPTSAKHKVYIIDEVHMLSKPAFNALLKTLEEPPSHVVFILATTDADKLPATIISRTQQFNFRSIMRADAVKHLTNIAKKEKIAIDKAALELIADHGDGSFRDSIGLLDQLQSLADKDTPISSELVEQILGLAPHQLVNDLLAAYESKNLEAIVTLLNDCDARGLSATILASQLVSAIRSQIAEKPQLVPLLDSLLDVAKSTKPSVKLLTVLAAHALPAPKSAALSATSRTISAPLVELERQATQEHPGEGQHAIGKRQNGEISSESRGKRVTRDGATPTEPSKASEDGVARAAGPAASDLRADFAVQNPTTGARKNKGTDDNDWIPDQVGNDNAGSTGFPIESGVTTTTTMTSTEARDQKMKADESLTATGSPAVEREFAWDTLVSEAKAHYVAIYSVLSKCDHIFDGTKLTIYTKNAFYKKKLDDPKHRVNLSKALEMIGAATFTLETIPSAKPPKNSQAAAVAAIMGGGEEVAPE